MLPVRDATLAQLDPRTLYGLLALRCEVFVLEQRAAYLDLDGRDLEPGARQLWLQDEAGAVLATLRLLDDGEVARIGRVATAVPARGRGLAARLMERALELTGARTVVLDAQAHLAGWYGRFGFEVVGGVYADEDGIPHVPMRREPPMSPRREPPMSPRREPPMSPRREPPMSPRREGTV